MRDRQQVLSINQHPALRAGKRRNAFHRGVTVDGQMCHLAEQSVDQAVEELVPTPDMPVDRGDRYPEFFGEAPHGECLHAVALDQAGGGVQDYLRADGFYATGGAHKRMRSDSGSSR